MLNYHFPLFRPPAEADNLIIQATLGCSHNSCTFCSMYKSKKYAVRSLPELFKEIDLLARSYPNANRFFLADGDALSLDTDHLITLLEYLDKAFPRLARVSVYATAQNLLEKSVQELKRLKEHKLSLIYFGIETGDDDLLQKIHKGVNTKQIIQALDKADEAKIKVSATVILGLGGVALSDAHIKATAKLINQTKIQYLSTLQLGLEADVQERFLKAFDAFTMPNDHQILKEQKLFIQLLHPKHPTIFRSNHASNALHLAGTLPKDKERLLFEIQRIQEIGEKAYVPKYLRGF